MRVVLQRVDRFCYIQFLFFHLSQSCTSYRQGLLYNVYRQRTGLPYTNFISYHYITKDPFSGNLCIKPTYCHKCICMILLHTRILVYMTKYSINERYEERARSPTRYTAVLVTSKMRSSIGISAMAYRYGVKLISRLRFAWLPFSCLSAFVKRL